MAPSETDPRTPGVHSRPASLTGRRVRAAVIGTGAIARDSHLPALARLAQEGETDSSPPWTSTRRRRRASAPSRGRPGGPATGEQAPWLAYSGERDGTDGHATLVFAHAPENDHTGARGAHPAHWFVRNDPFAGVAPSWAFHDELELAPDDTLTRRYRVVVADGAWEREEIVKYLDTHPW